MATKKNSPATAGSNPTNSKHATAADGGSIVVEPRNTGIAAELIDATTPALAERELLITIWHDDCAQFEGSAAQLVAEGIAPKGIVWPRARADSRWEADGFDYWVRRTRPQGWKGSMKSWLEVDNWFIRIQVSGRDHTERNHLELMRKAAELRAEFHRCTPAGRREWAADRNRYWAAHDDKAFQAFKALIPGLIPAKRGRKAKPA